ncbi:MAG: hypothetical protein JST26_08640 [Bacteroidetes bacterium]|nr:hypothetical protein [Bacteroidota bacterium]
MRKDHFIKQQRFHISTADGDSSRELFDETSRLFNTQLHQITTEVFDSLTDEKLLVYIDRLEIDLGLVAFPYSTRELADTYRQALTEALSAHLETITGGGPPANVSTAARAIEFSYRAVLEQYLLYGTIAAWAGDLVNAEPDRIFEKSMEEDVTALAATLNRLLHDRDVRQRLVYNFSETIARQTVKFVAPADADYIVQYHQEVSILQHTHQFVKAPENTFRKALWLFILDFLANKGGSYFNRKMFARQTILSIANHYNISFDKLLFYLSEAIRILPEQAARNQELMKTIRDITEEHLKEDFQRRFVAADTAAETQGGNRDLQTLFFFLVNGFFRHTAYVPEKAILADWFMQAIDTEQEPVLILIRQHGKEALFRRQVLTYLGEPVIRKIIRVLEPADAEGIFHYIDLTIGLQQQHHIVKSTESDFRQSLWDLVLLFLLADRGSVFNLRVFIESHVKALAAHYNMEFRTLLACLVQEVGQVSTLSNDKVSLFYILIEILKGYSGNQEILMNNNTLTVNQHGVGTGQNSETAEKIQGDAAERVDTEMLKTQTDRNALLHWIEHGTLPWWRASDTIKPEELFRNFVREHPYEAVLLLKMALISGKLSPLFFVQHENALLEVMQHVAEGSKTVLLYQWFTRKLDSLQGETGSALMKIALAQAYTGAYSKQGFTSFDSNWFFSSFLAVLERSLSSHAYKNIVSELGSSEIVKTTDAWVAALSSRRKSIPGLLATGFTDTAYMESEVQLLLEAWSAVVDMPAAANTPEDKAFYLVSYFLQYATWPSSVAHFNDRETELLLHQLSQFLFKRNRHRLITLFERTDLPVTAKLRLFETILNRTVPTDSVFKMFIHTYNEKAWRSLAREAGLAGYAETPLLHAIFTKINALVKTDERTVQWIYFLNMETFRSYAARQLSEQQFIRVLKESNRSDLGNEYTVLLEVFIPLLSDSFEKNQLGIWLREFFFGILVNRQSGPTDHTTLLQKFILFLHHFKRADLRRWSSQLKKQLPALSLSASTDRKSLLAQLDESLDEYVMHHERAADIKKAYSQSEEALVHKLMPGEVSLSGEKNVTSPEGGKNIKSDKKKEAMRSGEEITIHNAGLVLLQPFYSHLFVRAGLMMEGKWTSDEKKARAVRLLQYAATENEQAEEHLLVLNKILCGMEPHEFLIETTPLTDEEKNTVDGMLKAVTQQWDKMKNTSVENFRASFLMREGFISSGEEAWMLQVSTKAYDILLQTLPWSYGFVKYSWMNKPLNVTWI